MVETAKMGVKTKYLHKDSTSNERERTQFCVDTAEPTGNVAYAEVGRCDFCVDTYPCMS